MGNESKITKGDWVSSEVRHGLDRVAIQGEVVFVKDDEVYIDVHGDVWVADYDRVTRLASDDA